MKPFLHLSLAALVLFAPGGCGNGGGAPDDAGPPETLTNVSPLEGTSAGGTQVTLTGSGFMNGSEPIRQIRFGEDVADDWLILDDATIVVIAPPGELGSTIITLWGTSAEDPLLTGGYRYIALTLYVAGGANAATDDLFRVDLDTKFVGLVGPIGFRVTSLAMRGDGVLFGVEDDPLRRLIRIDPNTGAGAPVALLRDGQDQPVDIRDLTFLGSRLLGRTPAGAPVEIDIALGGVSFLPPIAGPVPGPGICIRDTDLSYVSGRIGDPIFTWGPVSGALLPHAVLTSPDVATIDALEFFDGVTYGVALDPGAGPSRLVQINPFTGVVDILVDLPAGIEAVARDL